MNNPKLDQKVEVDKQRTSEKHDILSSTLTSSSAGYGGTYKGQIHELLTAAVNTIDCCRDGYQMHKCQVLHPYKENN